MALYFAVARSTEEDGEIWCIRPDRLNALSGYFLHSADRPIIKYLAGEAFTNEDDCQKRRALAEELHLPQPVTRNPVAFLPPMEFPRMSAQSSRFTIHPCRSTEIQELLTGPHEIVRYQVPSDCKPQLSRDLTALEVTEETLFRSLDALSRTIHTDVYATERGDTYPDPPVFD